GPSLESRKQFFSCSFTSHSQNLCSGRAEFLTTVPRPGKPLRLCRSVCPAASLRWMRIGTSTAANDAPQVKHALDGKDNAHDQERSEPGDHGPEQRKVDDGKRSRVPPRIGSSRVGQDDEWKILQGRAQNSQTDDAGNEAESWAKPAPLGTNELH